MPEATMQIAPTNAEQARAWDGDEGAYWAAHAERFDRSVEGYRQQFFAAAAITPGDRVLDIGCGNGQTTREAGRLATEGSALGVDLSSRMIELARRLAADDGLDNVAFEQADAQVHPFPPAAFDVAISRSGTMFFGDPAAAFGNIARAIRPGGHLTMLVWQGPEPNEWIREFAGALAAGRPRPAPPADAHSPFALADPSRVTALLTGAGFADVAIEGVETQMVFGTDADDAETFILGLLGWMLEGLDDSDRHRAVDNLRTTLAAHSTDNGVRYNSAAWIVRAAR
jgi:SAM-dependent methyltransferase